MATVNDKIFDRIVDHMADVRLYENGVQKQNVIIVQKHRKNLKALLTNDIRADVKPEVTRFGKELLSHKTKSLTEFSKAQVIFHKNNIDAEVKKFYRTTKPKTTELIAEITGPNIKGVKTVSKNVSNIASGELVRIQSKVKAGLAKGLSQDEIIGNVMKTTKITEHQARTLTRTSITSTQTQALNAVMENNKDLLEGYMFTAILDARTSPICSHHNGKVYKLDEVQYRPPLHWNCRSSMVPVVKSKEDLAKMDSKNIKPRSLAAMHSADLDGRPSPVKSFGDWLRKQHTDVQAKLLGGERQARMFQKGRLNAEEFVTPQGKALSLRGLMRRANKTVTRPTNMDASNVTLRFNTPDELLSSSDNTNALKAFFKADAQDNAQALALADFKGNSLSQKQASRRAFKNNRSGSMLSGDGADYTNGALQHMQEPIPEILQERLERVATSEILDSKQKKYITKFVTDLDNQVSVNQQSVITDVMRQTFETFNRKGEPFANPVAVYRTFTRNATQDLGTLMFNRSVDRGRMFGGLTAALKDDPEVNILGKKFTMSELVDGQLNTNRYIDTWRATNGAKLARRAYFSGKSPIAAYTQPIISKYPKKPDLVKLFKKKTGIKKIEDFFENFAKPKDGFITRFISTQREKIQSLVDLDFMFKRLQKEVNQNLRDKSINATAKAMEMVALADGADYDTLAIRIGKMFDEELGDLNPFRSKTLADFHKDGSRILKSLEDQKFIKLNVMHDVGTSSPIDILTGRPSSDKSLRGVSVTRQIQILNGPMKDLQLAGEKVRQARRFGVYSKRNRLYAKAGNKEYFDARGKRTKQPVVSEKVYPDYDPNQVDTDIAKMLNHATSVQYEVDEEFFDFAERVIYFSDKRGQAQFYDDKNVWKELFMSRGNDGRGVLATAKFHRSKNRPFTVDASIDFRGRVYHRGLLTPTKGETVRPFLNTHKAVAINPDVIEELQTQIGAAMGDALDVLTVSGRKKAFRDNEKFLLELGELMTSKTQLDRRVKRFIEMTDGVLDDEHVGKVSRLALEYYRIHRHMGGKMYTNKAQWSPDDIKLMSKYKTKMMIENDASSSGAQIISLSTRDRRAANLSNVVLTDKKQRLYDEIAKRTVEDPEFLAIPELQNLDLSWSDLMKAAKNQNMVTFYGAGDATKANNVANAFAKVLAKKGKVTISSKEVEKFKSAIQAKISFEMDKKNWKRVDELRDIQRDVVLASKQGKPITESLYETAKSEFTANVKNSEDMHMFLAKLTDETGDLVGTRVFEKVSNIMSKYLEEEVPVTGKFIKFWKDTAKDYVNETGSVEIPWVTFDGKTMMQRYYTKDQARISFTDPVTGKKVFNIYEEPLKKVSGTSVQDAAIGLGVNGNHSNDAVIVRRFHLWGRKNNVDTGTIHDAFFTNLGDAVKAKWALRDIYADALEGDTIKRTLKKMRDSGLSKASYNRLLDRAIRDGLIYDPSHPYWKQYKKDIIAKFGEDEWNKTYKPLTSEDFKTMPSADEDNDWYGIGP